MTLVIPDEDVLLEAIGGSRCYNLHTPVSDTDIRGITFSKLDYMLDLVLLEWLRRRIQLSHLERNNIVLSTSR